MISLTYKIDEIVASISSESQEILIQIRNSPVPYVKIESHVIINQFSLINVITGFTYIVMQFHLLNTKISKMSLMISNGLVCTVRYSIIITLLLIPTHWFLTGFFPDETDFETPSGLNITRPSFEIASKLTNLLNLSDYDIDENINNKLNSKYYSVQDLGSLEFSNKDFAIFQMNIRSLPLHYEEFHALLSSIKTGFQVICPSEIKVSTNVPLKSNVDLQGYKFHHTPSHSAAGAVGIYVNKILLQRKGMICLSMMLIWIKVDNPQSKNILCCCEYRHPSSDISKFTDQLQDINYC